MTEPISAPDILAFADVLNDIATEAEDASLRRLLELEDSLVEVANQLKSTLSLITTAMLRHAKEPQRVGSTIYHAEQTGKWRPEHPVIRRRIIGRAVHTDDGENITDPVVAADRAVAICYAMFVSPSTMPKKEGLDAVGLDRSDVAGWENTGFELKRDRVKGVPDEA